MNFDQNVRRVRLLWLGCLMLQCFLLWSLAGNWKFLVGLGITLLSGFAIFVAVVVLATIVFSIYKLLTAGKWVKAQASQESVGPSLSK